MTVTKLIIVIVSITLLAIGCNKPPTQSQQAPSHDLGKMTVPDSTVIDQANHAAIANNPHGIYVNQITVDGKPTIDAGIADTADAVKQFIKHTGVSKYVLFFYAPWCPFCKVADKAFLDRVGEIPADVAVIKIDYDTHPTLKKQYGVTYQHTFVQIDATGNLITKWNGGDIENLKKYIK